MSDISNWSYTAKATLWRNLGKDDDGVIQFSPPILINCDYGADSRKVNIDVGREKTVKNVIWTEYSEAKLGDFVLIGESDSINPLVVDAEEIIQIRRFADTFSRKADDFAWITEGA